MSVKSPCINVCRMDANSGLCEGCLRTVDEIAGWAVATDDAKRLVLAAIAQRRAASPPPLSHGDFLRSEKGERGGFDSRKP